MFSCPIAGRPMRIPRATPWPWACAAVLACASVFVVSCGGAPNVAREPSPPVDDVVRVTPDLEVRALAPGVWLHTTWRTYPGGTRFPSNGLIVESASGPWLVDSAWGDEPTLALVDWIGSTWGRPPAGLIATHHHDDRFSAIAELRRRGIRIVAHPRTVALAREDGVDVPDGVEVPAALAEVGGRTGIGAMEMFYPGPGHAVDNIVVWIADAGVLFGGCLVRPAGTSSLGNTDDADLDGWRGAVARVQARYGRATRVVPGHGAPVGPEVLAHNLEILPGGTGGR